MDMAIERRQVSEGAPRRAVDSIGRGLPAVGRWALGERVVLAIDPVLAEWKAPENHRHRLRVGERRVDGC